MKKIFSIVTIIMLSGAFLFSTVDETCKQQLLEKYANGKYLVLKKGGIPTMVEKLPGNLGTKTYSWIVIKKDGNWKAKSILGSKTDSTNILEEKEILLIWKVKIKKKALHIWTRTDRALPYDASGRTSWLGSDKAKSTGKHANFWDIKTPQDWDCATIEKAVAEYFDVYDSKDAVSEAKELKLGMTPEEVENILGKPKRKANLGEKMIYKYEDTIVTFVDGKVSNIEFK